ncbi:MAG TPA: response regulator [Spirochaetota bacterium]|nr:response regulator [Spirochaetota bacterium]HPJ39109.1 response regulator [Spirochaetota bacterium]HPQ53608.1 response regulator [Spirochaetota bacterium]
MINKQNNDAGEGVNSPAVSPYKVFDALSFPVCVVGTDGEIFDKNSSFIELLESENSTVRLDLEHPFFPEYRRRIAVSYLRALRGQDKHCFAVLRTTAGERLPVEIYLYPMKSGESVASILVFLKIVDNRILSFDKSTSLMIEESAGNNLPIYEFSPFPIIRINREGEILYASPSLENLTGYGVQDIQKKQKLLYKMVSHYSFEKIKRAILYIQHGRVTFKRIAEIKLTTKNDEEKWVNLTIYPIIRQKEVVAVELIVEDISKIKRLENRISLLSRIQLIGDITKGLLHSFNNIINIIMSRSQLLLQITEKEAVLDGIRVIEKTAVEGVKQVRRIEDFIGEGERLQENEQENLINILEDAIEFAKIQFKVEEKEKRRFIKIEKKYYSRIVVHTNIRLLRELLVAIIFRVANIITRDGVLSIVFKDNGAPALKVTVKKTGEGEDAAKRDGFYNAIDLRRIAENINMKIIEEESAEEYSIQTVIPSSMIVDKDKVEAEDNTVKVRDLDVMIVEDEKELQDILNELFNKMGNRVAVFANGEDALAEFKEKQYDILITDYQVQGITGLELSARIKEINEDTLTVLLSGWMLNDLKAYKNVVDVYYPKPFKLDDLITGISKLMTGKRKNGEQR